MSDARQTDELAMRLDALEQLASSLEARARTWKRLGIGFAACASILVGGGAATISARPTVEGGEFILRDGENRVRVALAIRPDGTPGLGFFDKTGRTRLSLELDSEGEPQVNLHDDAGHLRAALAIRPNGTPGLGIFDAGHHVRASMDMGLDGTSGANVFGIDGVLRAALAVRPDGTPGVGLFDAKGAVLRSIEAEPDTKDHPEIQ